jgi:hypothetical protein
MRQITGKSVLLALQKITEGQMSKNNEMIRWCWDSLISINTRSACHKKRAFPFRQKSNTAMIRVILGFVVVLIFSFVAVSCGGGDSKDELPAEMVTNPGVDGKGTQSKTAKINFVKDEHDFGVIRDGEKVFWNFRFTNEGNAPLVINRVKADCGCTVPEHPRTPIDPGQEERIKVTFDSKGRLGRQVKRITVISNSERPSHVLTISALVEK